MTPCRFSAPQQLPVERHGWQTAGISAPCGRGNASRPLNSAETCSGQTAAWPRRSRAHQHKTFAVTSDPTGTGYTRTPAAPTLSNSALGLRNSSPSSLDVRPQAATASSFGTSPLLEAGTAVLEESLFPAQAPLSHYADPPRFLKWLPSGEQEAKLLTYGMNVGVIGLAVAAALTKVVTVDAEVWAGWSLWEIVSRIPQDNWALYESALAANPIYTKACISGVVYSLGDLTAQVYEGRSLPDLDLPRTARSGAVGFIAHGPLSHCYYLALDSAFHLLPVNPAAWYLPFAKVAVDQTAWTITWNAVYYTMLGALALDAPEAILHTVRTSWWDLLKAGWRLWPLAHVITYAVVPIQHRLLWVDMVELVWVTILSIYGQQQRDLAAQAAAAAAQQISSAAAPDGGAASASGTVAALTQVACVLPGASGEGGSFAEEILRGIQSEREVVFEDAMGHQVVRGAGEVYEHPEPPTSQDFAGAM